MKSISRLAVTGCTVSLQYNNDSYNTLETLKLSRGAINRLIINLRNNLLPLYKSYPRLVKRFEDLRILVNTPSESRESAWNTISIRNTLVSKLNDLISEIRTKDGFEKFQAFSSKNHLLNTAAAKTRVLLNTTYFRIDAVIIYSNGNV